MKFLRALGIWGVLLIAGACLALFTVIAMAIGLAGVAVGVIAWPFLALWLAAVAADDGGTAVLLGSGETK